jgi:hypothetical protein
MDLTHFQFSEGNYFTGTRGSGTKYFAGDHISKIKLYMYMQPDNPIALMKRNLMLQSILLHLDLKGGVLCVDYNTGKVLNQCI